MDELSLADNIRTFAYNTYVAPNLVNGGLIRIRAGDLHKAMGFKDRVPAVVEALRANLFQKRFGLYLVEVEGAPVSTSTTFIFQSLSAMSAVGGTLAALSDPTAVVAAMAEFRATGRKAFLSKYSFGPAQRYFVLDKDGHAYDSKAIAGVAHAKQYPELGALPAGAFSGGEATVCKVLEKLGFQVADFRADAEEASLPLESTAWAEVTSFEHGHGGEGWELGQWLWSPTTSKDGAARYAVMLQPSPGDQVFHLVTAVTGAEPKRRFLYGVSSIAQAAVATDDRPILPGAWSEARSFYRIALTGFQKFAALAPMDEVERELGDLILADLAHRPKYYPYSPYGETFRGSQGIYLTKLTPALVGAFRELAGVGPSLVDPDGAKTARTAAHEFAEGERGRREASFFKRNPALRDAAISAHGLSCAVCTIDFGRTYGEFGKGYIEIHHLDPLSERLDSWSGHPRLTTVDDVAPLCANCHRMAHRRRPPYSLDELRDALRQAEAHQSDTPSAVGAPQVKRGVDATAASAPEGDFTA